MKVPKMAQIPSPPTLEDALANLPSFRDALDAHAMIVVTDLSGRICDINDRLLEVSGYTREELIGSTHAIMISSRQDRSFYEQLWKTISADRIWRGTLCNRAKSGHLYWLATTIGPLFDAKGRKVGYVGLRTDITREKLGHLLLEHQQRLHARLHQGALLSSLIGELLAEIEEIRPELRLAVMRINTRGRLTTLATPRMPAGYLDAVEGVSVAESGLANARAVRERRAVFLCDGEGCQAHADRMDPDAARLMREHAEAGAWWSFPIQGSEDEGLGTLDVFVRDARMPDEVECYLLETLAASLVVAIFHKRSIELYRRYMADMETLSLQREGVLRTIGHEMRTPLNHILGFADLLVRDVEDPQLRDWALFIRDAGRNLMSKVEKSENFLSTKPQGASRKIDLVDYLKERLCEWDARGEREIVFVAHDEPLCVRMSRADLDRAVDYLLENVERHTPEETKVSLSLGRRGGEALIELSDDGPGAKQGDRGVGGLIRETSDISDSREGLGLGLAAARHLIQRNGGRMMAGTSAEDGFTVLIRLPLIEELGAEDAERKDESAFMPAGPVRQDQD
ncbi:MAG: PAS domain S-box protein [Alphaproteobacteria bacterium]|nr:MAG: PAS domain S-box protein [Alphaproteobacteria bacterium]